MSSYFYSILSWILSVSFWIVVVFRFSQVRQRGKLNAQSSREAWLSWVSLLGVAVSTTLYNPAVRNEAEAIFGKWFDKSYLVGAFSIGIYLIWVYMCNEFVPELRPRHRHWAIYVACLTIGVGALIVWAVASGRVVPAFIAPNSSPTSLVMLSCVLVFVVRVILPSLWWMYKHERQRPSQLRFLMMCGVHVSVALWVIISAIEHLFLGFGFLSFYFLPLFNALMVVFFITVIPAYFAPTVLFVWLAMFLGYVGTLYSLFFIRSLELVVARHTHTELTPLTLRQIMVSPTSALYQSSISILDHRKFLEASDTTVAQWLNLHLAAIAQRTDALSYPEQIRALCAVSKTQFFATFGFRLR